tara:strand:- start:2410 stop:2904 length:495 start_codon:yes stop_codon:yes gene_type:complete
MAETLSVTDSIPNSFEHKMKNRFILSIEGIDAFLIRDTKRPSVSIEDTQINWLNSYRKISSGKAVWSDITVVLHDPIAPSGAQQMTEWLRTVAETVSGRSGYADFYKRDLQLKVLDPTLTVIELWDIKGAFPKEIDFGDLSQDSANDIMTISVTLAVDNCVLQF